MITSRSKVRSEREKERDVVTGIRENREQRKPEGKSSTETCLSGSLILVRLEFALEERLGLGVGELAAEGKTHRDRKSVSHNRRYANRTVD